MNLPNGFKEKVQAEIALQRKNFSQSDAKFANKLEIDKGVYSRLKNGKTDKLLSDEEWMRLGRLMGVQTRKRKWVFVETEVYKAIKEDILFCKEYSKSMMFIDTCEIGKSAAAKYLSKTLPNTFYVDCSQNTTKHQFIRAIAKAIGVNQNGKLVQVLDDVKYALNNLENPIIILDEAGDLEYPAFLSIKQLWNAAEGLCGWYMLGANGLRAKIDKAIKSEKVGYEEIYSRFGSNYQEIMPLDVKERREFNKKLLTDVATPNVKNKALIPEIIRKCLAFTTSGKNGGLRRLEALIILAEEAA
jgi:hypothetical protein